MRKRSRTKNKVVKLRRTRDVNQLARAVVERTERLADGEPAKNPHAVALGRKGGLVGGKKRAENMTAKERSEAARQAVLARWARRESDQR